MNRLEVKAALARLDEAWIKRVHARAELVRADQAREASIAASSSAADRLAAAADEVFEARNALTALLFPGPPPELDDQPEPDRSFE